MNVLDYLQSQLRYVEPSGKPNPDNEPLQYLLKAIDVAKGLPPIELETTADDHDLVAAVLFCTEDPEDERHQLEFCLMVAYLQVVKAMLDLKVSRHLPA